MFSYLAWNGTSSSIWNHSKGDILEVFNVKQSRSGSLSMSQEGKKSWQRKVLGKGDLRKELLPIKSAENNRNWNKTFTFSWRSGHFHKSIQKDFIYINTWSIDSQKKHLLLKWISEWFLSPIMFLSSHSCLNKTINIQNKGVVVGVHSDACLNMFVPCNTEQKLFLLVLK